MSKPIVLVFCTVIAALLFLGQSFAYGQGSLLGGGSGFVGTVSLLAGRPGIIGDTASLTPVPAKSAQFISPTSVVGESTYSSVLVADQSTIQNISNGFVRVIAGQPRLSGFIDGPVGTALISVASGLRLSKNGNNQVVYFCDIFNNAIRKLENNVISTVAGNSTAGLADGTGPLFNKPVDLELGPDGSIYVADNANDAVRRIAPNGVTSTVLRVGSLQPKALRNSIDNTHLAISCVISGRDSILLYFYSNQTYTVIANNLPSGGSSGMEFDSDGNLFFQTRNAFYVLYKKLGWARSAIVEGNGYQNGEYPSTRSPPRFQGIQCFSRVKGAEYVFAEGSSNFDVRSITIYPEMTIVPWSVKVAVDNIPVWNITWINLISTAAREDIIQLVGWNNTDMYNGTAPFPDDAETITKITSSDIYTNFTSFRFEVPVFLVNATTRDNLVNFSWPRVRSIVDSYYAPQTLVLTVPARGMPIDPFSSPFPTNTSSIIDVQYAITNDLSNATRFQNASAFGVQYAQYNITSVAFDGKVTDAVKLYFTFPGRLANNNTANALIGAYTDSLFRESAAIASNPPAGDTPTSITTLPKNGTSQFAQEIHYLNRFRPFSLSLPNPMPGAANGGYWPVNNATAMRDAVNAVLESLGLLTGMEQPPSLHVGDFISFYAQNLTLINKTDNNNNIFNPSYIPFSVDPLTNTITLFGTIKGPVENQTTTEALIANYGSTLNFTLGTQSASPLATVIADSIIAYNAPQEIKIYFDASAIPFGNATLMGPIIDAFERDITRYFVSSPFGGPCCVSVNTTNYEILEGGIVVFEAMIPGAYYNDSTNAAFVSRNLHNASLPISPFSETLVAIEEAAKPRSVWLSFDLENIPGVADPNNPPTAMNFPLNNASALANLIIGKGIARDVAKLIGIGEDKVIVNRTNVVDPKDLYSVVSTGIPSYEIDVSGGTNGGKAIRLHLTIPCGAYNDTTNTNFAARSSLIASAVTSSGGDATAPAVNAALLASYPDMETQRGEYYATKVLPIVFTPAGDFPLYTDPVPRPETTAPIPTFILSSTTSTTTAAVSGSSTASTTMASSTSAVTTSATTPAPTANLSTSHMGVLYGLFYEDIMRIVRGNINYPTDPNVKGATLVPVSPIVEYSPDYDIVMRKVNRSTTRRVSIRNDSNIPPTETAVDITTYQVIDVPSVVFKIKIPGPFYNESTLASLTTLQGTNNNKNDAYNNGKGIGSVDGPDDLSDGWLDPSIFPNIVDYVSATTVYTVTFSPLVRWPLDNSTRMHQLRRLLLEDASDFFGYSGNYLNLSSDLGGGASSNPTIVNATPATSTQPAVEGTITWSFNIPNVCFPVDGPFKNISTYNFPKTSAALDDNSNSVQTTFRGMAPSPTFFGEGCGKGCVIGIAVGCAAALAVIAVIAVVVASKRKRRSDVVSPNFNPGKIGVDLD